MAKIEAPYVAASGTKSWRVTWTYDGKAQRGPRLRQYTDARTMALAINALDDRISAQDERIRTQSIIRGEAVEVAPTHPTHLGHWLDVVLGDVEVKPQSLRQYRYSRTRLRRWDREDVQSWTQRESHGVVKALQARYTPRTIAATIDLLQRALLAARDARVIDVMPKRPKVLGTRIRVGKALTQPQAAMLLDALGRVDAQRGGQRAHDAVLLALASGLRIGEVMALRVDDLNAVRRAVKVDETISDSQRQVGPPKSESSERSVTVGDDVWAMLQRRAEGLPLRGFLFAGMGRNPLAVPDTSAVRTIVRRTADELAEQGHLPEGLRFHDLRHTHGSWLLDQRRSATAVAARLGHTVAQLDRVYAHTGADVEVDMAADVAAMLAPARTRLEVVA